jgi:hypothetical protein
MEPRTKLYLLMLFSFSFELSHLLSNSSELILVSRVSCLNLRWCGLRFGGYFWCSRHDKACVFGCMGVVEWSTFSVGLWTLYQHLIVHNPAAVLNVDIGIEVCPWASQASLREYDVTTRGLIYALTVGLISDRSYSFFHMTKSKKRLYSCRSAHKAQSGGTRKHGTGIRNLIEIPIVILTRSPLPRISSYHIKKPCDLSRRDSL